jgi:Na+/H+ antiporter NhaD/arsenite permease-like protein
MSRFQQSESIPASVSAVDAVQQAIAPEPRSLESVSNTPGYVVPAPTPSWLQQERKSIFSLFVLIVLLVIMQTTSSSLLDWPGWYTIWVTSFCMAGLIRGVAEPEIVLWFANALLLVARVITVEDTFAAFSNSSIVTIGLMVVVVSSLRAAGALEYLSAFVMGQSQSQWKAQARMMTITACVSGFINNIPLCSILIPVIERWCKDNKVVSLLLDLSL